MTRWTEGEDAKLVELVGYELSPGEIAALLEDRSESAIQSRAARLGLSLQAAKHRPLRDYLEAGGRIVRDEIGGVVGIRWGKAIRTGETFSTPFCERLFELGFIEAERERLNVFHKKAA